MAMNTDRRRINGPSGGTSAPVFARIVKDPGYLQRLRPSRARGPDELRKIFLQTGIVPSASGSAYLEIPVETSDNPSLIPSQSSLKVVCSIHGPKPLPRSAPFSPHLLLTTTVKFAPFATRNRRGYIRDSVERDLGVHLETALRGVLIGERWPKSGVEVIVTVIEGDEDAWWGDGSSGGNGGGWGLLNILAGCITVSGAAIADAGIDCVDMVSGGVAAIVRNPQKGKEEVATVVDPCPAEHQEVIAACAVGYLSGRDEITELWLKGDVGEDPENLINKASQAAAASLSVVKDVITERVMAKFQDQLAGAKEGLKRKDSEMDTTT